MIKIEKEHYNSTAKLLAECFLEDQLVEKQTKGIANPEIFLEKLFLLQLPVLQKAYEMNSLDDNLSSVIVGYEKKKYNPFRVIWLSILCQFKLLHTISAGDRKLYAENGRAALKNVDLKWYSEFVKGNYYYIKIIAIAKDSRKRGIFRQLMMPIISYCDEKSIPIILETNTAENVPVYQHFGFELVKTIPEEKTDFCQYCFIKQPYTTISHQSEHQKGEKTNYA